LSSICDSNSSTSSPSKVSTVGRDTVISSI
jgi:hypothetical protein